MVSDPLTVGYQARGTGPRAVREEVGETAARSGFGDGWVGILSIRLMIVHHASAEEGAVVEHMGDC